MQVMMQDRRMGQLQDELQAIEDLAGLLEKQTDNPEAEVSAFRIRLKAQRIQQIIRTYGTIIVQGGAA